MSRTLASIVIAAAATGALFIAGCSGGEVAVGRSNQQLQTKTNGDPTGNGQTCSWDGTVAYDTPTGAKSTSPESGPYKISDTFKSPDGCNDCSCTASGIACTTKACTPGSASPGNPSSSGGASGACPDVAKLCPDGSYVGPTGPTCEIICPPASDAGKNVACAQDAKQCPDGSYVVRVGPSCDFAPCP